MWVYLAGMASTETHQGISNISRALHVESAMDLDTFANELIQCVQGRSIYEVISTASKVDKLPIPLYVDLELLENQHCSYRQE